MTVAPPPPALVTTQIRPTPRSVLASGNDIHDPVLALLAREAAGRPAAEIIERFHIHATIRTPLRAAGGETTIRLKVIA